MASIRNQFRAFCPLTKAEQRALSSKAVFVLDANVLLHSYRYSSAAREEFLAVLKLMKSRLWIPHQVAYEFHRERVNVIGTQLSMSDQVRAAVEQHLSALVTDFEKVLAHRYHPFLDRNVLGAEIEKTRQTFSAMIDAAMSEYPTKMSEDPVLEELHALMEERVGEPFSGNELEALYAEAEKRYASGIPPGYKDGGKPAPERYGDFIIWRQILTRFKDGGLPVVLVTDDAKEDWLLKTSGRIVSMRPELRQEFYEATGQPIAIYGSERFVQQGTKDRAAKVDKVVLAEISDQASSIAQRSAQAELWSELLPWLAELGKVQTWPEIGRSLADLRNIQMSPEIGRTLADVGKFQMSPEIVRSLSDLGKIQMSPEIVRSLADLGRIQIPPEIVRSLADLGRTQISPEIVRSLSGLGKIQISPEIVRSLSGLGNIQISPEITRSFADLGKTLPLCQTQSPEIEPGGRRAGEENLTKSQARGAQSDDKK